MKRTGLACICLFLLNCMLFLLGGCKDGHSADMNVTPEKGQYRIYFVNQAKTKLAAEQYESDTADRDSLLEELLARIEEGPESMRLTRALPDTVRMKGHSFEDENTLRLNFENSYNELGKVEEVLCRAALIRTLTQIEGIDNVLFVVEDSPLADGDGNLVGVMTAADFVDTTGDDTNDLQKLTLTLYFANEDGSSLVETERELVCSNSISLEKLVVSQLIEGPDGERGYPTLPKNLAVLSVSVKDGICYVNVDNTFISEALDVNDYIPVYSIVDSLSELPNISKVQISVEGSSKIKFRDSISFETPLERNLDYVGGKID